MISILVGKGVGGGAILDGKILHGAFGMAGEIGHASISFDGPLCECGNRGCLELYGSTLALKKQAQVLLGLQEQPSFQAIKEQINAGDARLMQLANQSGAYLGYAIVNLVNTFNPELVVLHGDMTELGDVWLGGLKQAVEERLKPEIYSCLRIECSTLDDDPVLLGTVAMVCEYLFDRPVLERFSGQ
jgi:predicted NBD/HSP70 family sugar kinase